MHDNLYGIDAYKHHFSSRDYQTPFKLDGNVAGLDLYWRKHLLLKQADVFIRI